MRAHNFDREVIILCVRWYLRVQAQPAGPGGDDGGARFVDRAHDHHALGPPLRTGVRKTLAADQPLLARSCGNHGVADKVRAPLHSTSTSRPRNSWQGQRAASDDIVPHFEIRPRWRGIPLALQASFDHARCRADSELSLKMTDADKIVAATFAVARCGGLGHSKPEDYIA